MKLMESIKAFVAGRRAMGLDKLGMEIGVAAIIIAVVLLILSNVQTNSSVTTWVVTNATTGAGHYTATTAYNAVGSAISAIGNIPTWFTIIVLVFIGALLINYVQGGFGRGDKGK